MSEHKATPEQWAEVRADHDDGIIGATILLELRARVEALEAAQRPQVFTADEVAPIVTSAAPAGSLVEPAEGLLDKSDAADAARFRWIISGNGYFVPHPDPYSRDPVGLDQTRQVVDEMMAKSNAAQQSSLKKSLSQEDL
jgi:hypothetical protein